MLESFHAVDTLPPLAGLNKGTALKLSHVFNCLGITSVFLAILLFVFVPAAQIATTTVSPFLLPAPYNCDMVSQVTLTLGLIKSARDGYADGDYIVSMSLENAIKSASGLPIDQADNGLPFARMFSSICNGGRNKGVYINPDSSSGMFCSFINDYYMQQLSFLSYANVVYRSYEACLADMTSAISCSANLTEWPQTYRAQYLDGGGGTGQNKRGVFCRFGTASRESSVVAYFSFSDAALETCTPPGMLAECQSTNTLYEGQLSMSFFTPSRLATAVRRVFTPRALCAPFSDGANPPYVCTRSERLSALTICIQALSTYETSVSALVTLLCVYLHARRFFGKAPPVAPVVSGLTQADFDSPAAASEIAVRNPLSTACSRVPGVRSMNRDEAIALLQRVFRGHAARRVVRGWVKVKDPESGETYYHNILSGRSEWLLPI